MNAALKRSSASRLLLACSRDVRAESGARHQQYAHTAWKIGESLLNSQVHVDRPDTRRISLARHGIVGFYIHGVRSVTWNAVNTAPGRGTTLKVVIPFR